MTWLWSKVSGLAAAVGAGIAILFAAWLKGRQDGKAVLRAEQEQKRAQARGVRKEIDDEVEGLGHADLDEHFNRWVRGPEQR